MNNIELIIINTIVLGLAAAFGSYLGWKDNKKDEPSAKLWPTLLLSESAILVGFLMTIITINYLK